MAPDGGAAVSRVVEALRLRRQGDGWTGEMPADVWGQTVFGGFVIAHAVSVAAREAPERRRLHSLHAYFLKPVAGGKSIEYRVKTLREGRMFASRLVEASQNNKAVLSMTCSFHSVFACSPSCRRGFSYHANFLLNQELAITSG